MVFLFVKEELNMLKDLIIRAEEPADYKNTELMAMRSFWNKYAPGCNEHLLVRIIRASGDYLPQISRVAEWNGRIVGAVYYTRAWIVDGLIRHEVVTFGPLAVEPTLEGNDIGGALMRSTIESILVLGFIYTFKVYDLVYVMTSGGPVNSTQLMSTYSYKLSFDNFLYSKGSAVANALLVILLLVGVVYVRITSRGEEAYE